MMTYTFSLQYNDTYAFRAAPRLTQYQRIHQEIIPDMSGRAKAGVKRCAKCGGFLAKWEERLDGLVIKKRKYDISITYDGVVVVSRRFVSEWKEHGLRGLVFPSLPDDPAFAAVRAERSVAFDTERMKPRCINKCKACGQYQYLVGATPVFLKPGEKIRANECVRSDLEFGSDDQKHPLLLCGEEVATVLTEAKLKGVCLVDSEK